MRQNEHSWVTPSRPLRLLELDYSFVSTTELNGSQEHNREQLLEVALIRVMFTFLLSILFGLNSPKFSVILKVP